HSAQLVTIPQYALCVDAYEYERCLSFLCAPCNSRKTIRDHVRDSFLVRSCEGPNSCAVAAKPNKSGIVRIGMRLADLLGPAGHDRPRPTCCWNSARSRTARRMMTTDAQRCYY